MLSSIIGYVVTAALSWFAGWVSKLIHQQQVDKKIAQDVQDSTALLAKADPEDGAAIDEASKKALGGF